MDRKFIIVTPVILLLLAGIALAAMPNQVEVQRGKATVTIPSNAVEVSDGVFYLGQAFHEGRIVQGYAFVKYKKDFAKPPWAGEGKGKGESKCYEFLARGAKWKVNEGYLLNPANGDGVSHADIETWTQDGIDVWESASDFNIFGTGELTGSTLVADTVYPDGINEIYFGDIPDQGVIAMAIVWGIWQGPPGQREIVEFDMVFDDEWVWGNAGESNEVALGDTSVMDYWNIFTHEIGHAAGMGHPNDSCTEETMYRFSQEGETKKRTLNSGDIAGISALY